MNIIFNIIYKNILKIMQLNEFSFCHFIYIINVINNNLILKSNIFKNF